MKKFIFILVISLGAGLVSCKKNYTCECKKIHSDDNGNSVTTSDGSYTFKDSRARAEDRCNDLEGTGTDIGGDYTRECDI